MAQPLQSINLVAPAFKGINTEDSPLTQDPSFAEIADNAVIDKRGRIAARKGVSLLTTDATELNGERIHKVHEFYDNAGNEVIFSTGNNKILSGTTTLVDETPGSYTITSNNWKIVNFNNSCYFFQRGYEPLVYNDSLGAVTKMSSVSGASVTSAQHCHEALAAFGRLWVVGSVNDSNTIYWSDLLIGHDFSGGSSGYINVEKAWPDGFDEVRALAAHNNLLIIFGYHSIIVYQGAESPANMVLADTVAGVGIVCRNSVQHIGTDVLFVSQTGLKSFGRTIQEKSLPLTDLSQNIKTDLISLLVTRTEPIATAYSPEESFYLLTFPDLKTTYCFDIRGVLPEGGYRVTRWPSNEFYAYNVKRSGSLLIGYQDSIGVYQGNNDDGSSYRFKYYSPALTFGDPSKTKILKKLTPTLVGSNDAPVFLRWAYNFQTAYKSQEFTVGNQPAAYFGESEYTAGQYTGGILTTRRSVNATGSGTVVTIGLEADIDSSPLSIQEINVLALLGKTV